MLDRLFQLLYLGAYRLMRVYWRLREPRTHGALVAVWHGGRVLIARNSYVSYYSLPGGYVRPGEDARWAARRELREEVGVEAPVERLEPALEVCLRWEGKRDHVEIFRYEPEEAPAVRPDNREVTEAVWLTPEEALARDLFPATRWHIEREAGGSAAGVERRGTGQSEVR